MKATLPARRYYHYTALDHAEQIVASGGISRGGIPIPDQSGQHLERVERGWQWLTKSGHWLQPWATMEHIDCDRTEVRLVVEIPLLELDRLRRWDDIAADFGYRPETARKLAALGGGESSSWFVFAGTIPKRWIVGIEKRPGLGDDVPPCGAWSESNAKTGARLLR